MSLSLIDLFILVAFAVVVLWLGFKERKKLSLDDYWVNNRDTGTFSLTATMSSSFLGASAIFAMAGLALQAGFAALLLGFSFVFYFIIFAIFLAPRIQTLGKKYNVYTLPQTLGVRFGRKTQVIAAVISLIAFGLFLGVQFLAIGGLISLFGNIDLVLATIISGLIVTGYISVGGLRADIRTDIFQFIVMIFLVVVFLPLLVLRGGGLGAFSGLSVNYLIGTEFLPPILIIAAFILLGPTIFSSLDVWQRALAARNPVVAKKGMLWAGVLLIPFFIMASLIGIYGKVLYGGLDPNTLIFQELIDFLPPVLLGIGITGFFAAVMSSADTMLLVLSQTLVNDISPKKFSPEKTLKYSRRISLVLGLVALVTAVTLLDIVDVAIGAVSFQVVIVPAVLGLFFWKRATGKAAFWSMLLGALVIVFTLPFLTDQAFLPGFLVSIIAFVLISLFTKHSTEEQLNL